MLQTFVRHALEKGKYTEYVCANLEHNKAWYFVRSKLHYVKYNTLAFASLDDILIHNQNL